MYYPDWYNRISKPFRDELSVQAINILDRFLVFAIAGIYVILIISLVASGEALRLPRFVAVPAVVFALVSAMRIRINAPRPYELYDINPIIVKDTQGRSMPSRHVASAVIIAFAIAWVQLDWGIIALIACAVVAFTRIVGGVHFPRDVVVSVLISVAFGVLFFVVIP